MQGLAIILKISMRNGNGKDFSCKVLVGGLPPPPDTDAFSAVAGVSFARILVTPGVIFSCDEQLKK